MANAWEMAKGLAEKHANSGGVFVRLASNGEKVAGVFCGEPYAREVVWTGERYEAFDPKNPAHQADGKRPSLRVAMNFFVLAENTMKVIEGGTQWFKDVLKVRDKYGLDKWSFEIQRHGDAGDPKTKYTILPEEKIDAQLRAKITEAQLHALEAMVGGSGDDEAKKNDKPASAPAKDGPIDPATAADLVARMKVLPRADLEALLGELGVQRVRDLTRTGVRTPSTRIGIAWQTSPCHSAPGRSASQRRRTCVRPSALATTSTSRRFSYSSRACVTGPPNSAGTVPARQGSRSRRRSTTRR